MCASPLSFLRTGPPPPKIALLSDAVFFTRSVPVAPGATAVAVATEVELALEALSPFPLSQLYCGHYWKPGADRAFAFAAYRRRFTTEQTAGWAGAELVLPAFAAIFGAEVTPATTFVLASPEGLTAVHWESAAGPAQVLFRPLAPEATDDDRLRTRDELIRAVGGTRTVVDLPAPVPEATGSDDEIIFRAGTMVSRLPAAVAAALDVRDKLQLAQLRRARLRDLWIWRAAVGCAAALVLLALGEFGLLAGNKLWQKARLTKIASQKPTVDKILKDQELAVRIEELATKRLLPFEMIIAVSEKKPAAIQFTSTRATALDTLVVDAKTNNVGEIGAYETAIKNLPSCEKVEIRDQRTVGDNSIFQMIVTFKPGALKPS